MGIGEPSAESKQGNRGWGPVPGEERRDPTPIERRARDFSRVFRSGNPAFMRVSLLVLKDGLEILKK